MTVTDQPSSPDRWSAFAPSILSIDPSLRGEFFLTAPTDTIVEIHDEVYLRLSSGDWRHLEDLVTEGRAYMTYETWDHSSPQRLSEELTSEYSVIRILRLGSQPAVNPEDKE